MKKKSKTAKIILFSIIILTIIIILIIAQSAEKPQKQYVLLSFDVEPVDEKQSVLEIADILAQEGVNATFFVTGQYAIENPETVAALSGFEVACHGTSHRPFPDLNLTEKQEELDGCKGLGKGFRAPYNRIDAETFELLKKNGFEYDASMIKGYGILYPEPTIPEIKVSTFLGMPLEDVVFLYYLHLKGPFFYIMKNKDSKIESFLFHPHHIIKEKTRLKELISDLKRQNKNLISHHQLVLINGG
jgi:peptidoglycan/xylan/chitin deacetylase (PgdA/CDA1 family)